MKQEYGKYTEEDQKVWGVLFERQMPSLITAATEEFSKGIEKVNFHGNSIPNFEATNVLLKELTGWEISKNLCPFLTILQ